MDGRLESKIKIENKINDLLEEMPEYVSGFYYNISVTKEPRTCLEYIYKIKKFLDYFNNPSNIKEVDDIKIAKFFKSIETKEINGKIETTSTSFRASYHSALKKFYDYLYKKGIIENNPMLLIERPAVKDDVKHVRLDKTDLKKILNAIDDEKDIRRCVANWEKERNRTILMLFITTGMRKTALTEINISDIDFNEYTLKVIDKRHKTHHYHLPNYMIDQINKYIDLRSMYCNKNNINLDALFISEKKNRMTPLAVELMVKKYTEKALGNPLSPHKLRGAFCTILYEETGDIEFVRDAVGHENIATTQRYIQKEGNSKIKATGIIGDILF